MPTPVIELNDLIRTAGSWAMKSSKQVEALVPPAKGAGVSTMYTVDTQELTGVHPSFPSALYYTMQKNARDIGRYTVSGLRVRCLASYYQQMYTLPSVDGKTHYWLNQILALGKVTDAGVNLLVHGYHIRTVAPGDTPRNGRATVPWISHDGEQLVEVPKAWMEERYPNWENRLLVGQSMGLTGKDLLHVVCSTLPDVKSASLGNLTLSV